MSVRRKTKVVAIGSVRVGGANPVVVQSMTKVPTAQVGRCVRQINRLAAAGSGLVRLAVPTRADTAALAKIVDRVEVPLIADVHFSWQRAVEAIEAGAAKVRLNPGNIKSREGIKRVIDAARMHKTAVRIGVNEASIRDLSRMDVPFQKRTALMLRELGGYVRIFEKRRFSKLVLSAKSSDILRNIEVNRRISENFDYPIHLGLTHAGLAEDAVIPSSIAIGTLLAEGIGDTIRVSAAGDPVGEVKIANRILISLGFLARSGPEFIVCPMCARAKINIITLAKKVKRAFAAFDKPVRIAVMGCIVNGPGEAADADLAVCAAKGKGWIYVRGRRISIVAEENIISAMLEAAERL